jgi:hypothetical protein
VAAGGHNPMYWDIFGGKLKPVRDWDVELNGDVTFTGDQIIEGDLEVGTGADAGFINPKNSFTVPVFGEYGLNFYNYILHQTTRDETGASWFMKVSGDVVIGSWLGAYYLAGFDLSPASYTMVKNWLWSTDDTYSPITPYDYEGDDLTGSLTDSLPPAVISLVNDADRGGVVFDYSAPDAGAASAGNFNQDFYLKATGIVTTVVTGWVASAWVKFPSTAYALDAVPTWKGKVGLIVRQAGQHDIGIYAEYDQAGNLETISAVRKTVSTTLNAKFTLVANPTAGVEYHFAMVCDGEAGIDYYVSDSSGALFLTGTHTTKTADEGDLALDASFETWDATEYGIMAFSGYNAAGVPEGDITDFRVDEFSFWKTN